MKYLERISEKLTHWLGTPMSILVHSIIFVGIFALKIFGYTTEEILLILTTAVSLEAIYLAIFIQMSVNKTTVTIAGVEKDIDDIQEDVEDLESNVKEISEDINDDEDDDEIIKAIKDIETRIVKLHKDIADINNQKQR